MQVQCSLRCLQGWVLCSSGYNVPCRHGIAMCLGCAYEGTMFSALPSWLCVVPIGYNVPCRDCTAMCCAHLGTVLLQGYVLCPSGYKKRQDKTRLRLWVLCQESGYNSPCTAFITVCCAPPLAALLREIAEQSWPPTPNTTADKGVKRHKHV